MRRRQRAWPAGLLLLLALLLGWAALQAQKAVVTVRFMPHQQDTVLDSLFLVVGSTKLETGDVRSGEVERFVFTPSTDAPLMLGFWIGEYNGGWDGPVLHPRQRLDITLDEEGHVLSQQECDWPCWTAQRAVPR